MSYGKDEYDLDDPEVVGAIDDLPIWSAPFGMKLLELIELRSSINVLDVGSGNGFPAIELSQRLGDTCRVYCVDPWKQACSRMERKIRVWGIRNIEIFNIGAEEMPFEKQFFDLIISNNGINNVENDRAVFSEIARVSRDRAQMVISVNLPGTMAEFYDVFRRVLKKRRMNDRIRRLDQHIFEKRKPVEYTIDLITGSGFEIEDVNRDSFQLCYTDGTTMLNNFFIKLAFLPFWRKLVSESERTGIFNSLESELNLISSRQGCLKLTVPWVCINARKKGAE